MWETLFIGRSLVKWVRRINPIEWFIIDTNNRFALLPLIYNHKNHRVLYPKRYQLNSLLFIFVDSGQTFNFEKWKDICDDPREKERSNVPEFLHRRLETCLFPVDYHTFEKKKRVVLKCKSTNTQF